VVARGDRSGALELSPPRSHCTDSGRRALEKARVAALLVLGRRLYTESASRDVSMMLALLQTHDPFTKAGLE
jgi:hypothetical protein